VVQFYYIQFFSSAPKNVEFNLSRERIFNIDRWVYTVLFLWNNPSLKFHIFTYEKAIEKSKQFQSFFFCIDNIIDI
jgi:hypothetical protein